MSAIAELRFLQLRLLRVLGRLLRRLLLSERRRTLLFALLALELLISLTLAVFPFISPGTSTLVFMVAMLLFAAAIFARSLSFVLLIIGSDESGRRRDCRQKRSGS
ncbi:MAG: hypothetical protein QM780_12365 [Hyphomicrobium sp.]|uniref:hypothetical protein n=1 Tax=Hyphomicrobium sp. TaxID=82 RepID=UPI0039E28430